MQPDASKQAAAPAPVTHSLREWRGTAVNSKSSFAHMQHVTDSPSNNNNNLYFSFFFLVFRMHWVDSNLSLPFACSSAFINRRLSKCWQSGKTTMKHVSPSAPTSRNYPRKEKKKKKIYLNIDVGTPMPVSVATHAENYRIVNGRSRSFREDLCRLKTTISFTEIRVNRLRAYECDCYFNIKCFFRAVSVCILVGLLLHQQHQHYHRRVRTRENALSCGFVNSTRT